MKKAPTNDMIKRSIIVLAVFILGFAFLIATLYNIQFVQYNDYQKKAVGQQTTDVLIPASRGAIFDRNGKMIANSASVERVFISPKYVTTDEERETIAQGLSEILGVDYDTIYKKAGRGDVSQYEVVKGQVEKETADKVREFRLEKNLTKAVHLEPDTRRYYPYGNFASHILGFTRSDGIGAYGLESKYEDVLHGIAGRKIIAKNGVGKEMPLKYETYEDAQNGLNLVLTIDEVVQHFLEKHLETAVIENKIRNKATGIIMDVKTGGILAMATIPDFDNNNPRVLPQEVLDMAATLSGDQKEKYVLDELNGMWRNKAISDTYEPGSAFKIITASMAIEEGVVSDKDTFYCPGYRKIGGRIIKCWKAGGHGTETFLQGMMNSCNVVFMELGARIGAERFYKYYEAFGLTQLTGIDLIGEASNKGLHHTAETLKGPVELAVNSFGQTSKVTPIQMITAAAAVANGGKLMKPYIVKELVDDKGVVKKAFEPTVVRQVISEKTAKEVCAMLELVVSKGTGKNAYVPGYRVGGKTATSEKIDKKNAAGIADLRIASFIGMAPMDDPQIAVLIIFDEPGVQILSGGIIAAPVVGRIMSDVLPYLGVEPKYTQEELIRSEVSVPNVEGLELNKATILINQVGVVAEIEGKGTTVLSQFPEAGARLPKSSKVILYTEENSDVKMVKVPNLVGKTLSEVNKSLGALSLNVKFIGAAPEQTSLATGQYPLAGEMIKRGSVVSVDFKHNEVGETGDEFKRD